MIKKIIVISVILGISFSNFSFAKTQEISPPENLKEAQKMIGKAMPALEKLLPETFKKIWQEEALPLWQKMYKWFIQNIWNPYFGPFFKKEIEKRKPIIKEEFQKEKEELKEEAPKIGKSLWEKFKELIK